MGAFVYERNIRRWTVGFAVFATMSVLAWVLPTPAQASPPMVTTDGAHATSATTAIVEGNANPEGQSTTLHADYALVSEPWCTSGGKEGTPNESASQTLPAINGEISEILVKLEGLTPGSEYCVALVAVNASGTANGGQVRFTTPQKTRTHGHHWGWQQRVRTLYRAEQPR
jgi:hypothetical protein